MPDSFINPIDYMKYPRIFVVDDDPLMLFAFKKFFKNIGYPDIFTFANRAELTSNTKLLPDIIFLDYFVENECGLDMLASIRRILPSCLVIFISGMTDSAVIEQSIKAGAADFILKGPSMLKGIRDILKRFIT